MNDYMEVRIDLTPCNTDITDVLAAILAEEGFESFCPDSNGLTAYIRCADYRESLKELPDRLPFAVTTTWKATLIEGQDWNREWEKHYFKPIVVGDRCVIHSSFHTDIPKCDYDIVIDPKMAFGTGHHSTTTLMLSRILETDMTHRSVIDMGTGTGILAILASMRGATPVTGIEIDEGAYINAIENAELNNRNKIQLICGDASALDKVDYKADFFLANINRNVITSDINRYAAALKPGGRMWLSGFYVEDIEIIEHAAREAGLETGGFTELNRWACVELLKPGA